MDYYECLVAMLETSDQKSDPDEEYFRSTLCDLATIGNSKGMLKLRDVYAKFNFRVCRNNFRDYNHALEIAQKDLESYAAEADKLYTNYKGEGTSIQEFCREVMHPNLN